MRLLCFFAVVAAFANVLGQSAKFKVIRQWNSVNFTWPSPESHNHAHDNGLYIPQNIIISGLKYFEGFYYITLPRMKDGVPATLTRIPAGPTKDTAPLLEPFPSWEMNNVGDCNALQNVQNVEIDTKGQLWIIDGGRVETLNPQPVVKCRPKLIIFDIRRNMTTTSYMFPEEVASFNGSFLYDLVVDSSDGGYAYITDNSGRDPGIIVYSVRDNRSWKIRHAPSMRADPTSSQFRVNDVVVDAPINIAGIALGPRVRTSDQHISISEDREVYYSPLSSLHLYSINTTILRDEKNANNGNEYQGNVVDYGLKQSQSVGMMMDNQGVLYYGLLAANSVARWDSHTPFQSSQKVIARDPEYLQWVTSLIFDDAGNITVLMNKLNRFIYGKMKLNEPNFRLISANVGGKSYLHEENYAYNTSDVNNTPTNVADNNNMPEIQRHDDDTSMMHMDDGTTTTMLPSSAENLIFTSLLLCFSSLLWFL